jgi:hypothetical protein
LVSNTARTTSRSTRPRLLPAVLAGLAVAVARDAGVVHQHVEVAVTAADLFRRGLDRGVVGHVQLDRLHVPAASPQFGGGHLAQRRVAGRGQDGQAPRGQLPGDGPADSLVRPGHQGDCRVVCHDPS